MTDYKIKGGKAEIITTASKEHSYFEVVKGIYAFKLTTSTTSSHPDIEDHEMVQQGLCKRTGIAKLRSGLSPDPAFGNKGQMIVVSDEILGEIKRFGYLALSARDFKGLDDTAVYDWLIGGGSTENVIRFYSYDHSFWRLDGTLIPTGIQFDYIDSRFHNLVYDLPKALAILSARDDVTFFDKEVRHRGRSLTEQIGEGAIQQVPYYNRDGGRTGFLLFCWTPTQEQADKLYTTRGSMDRFKTIFEDDMLGLRAGGAALFPDEYYKQIEVESDDDDDPY